jgi:uncharacterized protein YutE (UPF0331/DUF86 family)
MSPLAPLRKKFEIDLVTLGLLEDYLRESCEICSKFTSDDLSRQDLREIGALSDRFQRAQDFFVVKILRIIDLLSGDSGTTLDVLQRAEQRGLIESAEVFLEMRALRNKIAHEYAGYGPLDIVKDILKYSAILLDSFARVRQNKS